MTDDKAEMRSVLVERAMPHPPGTHVRMEQSGFRPEGTGNYNGANYGWQKYFAGLERVAAELQ
jgi:hypothetical protein